MARSRQHLIPNQLFTCVKSRASDIARRLTSLCDSRFQSAHEDKHLNSKADCPIDNFPRNLASEGGSLMALRKRLADSTDKHSAGPILNRIRSISPTNLLGHVGSVARQRNFNADLVTFLNLCSSKNCFPRDRKTEAEHLRRIQMSSGAHSH